MKSSIQKWIVRSAFCTLCLVSKASVQAQEAAPVTNYKQSTPSNVFYLQQLDAEPAKFRLHYTNATTDKVVLTITDREGNTLLTKKIEQANFAQTFDLSNLKDGSYTFTLQKGKDVVKKTVQLNTDYVMVKKAYIK